MFRALTTSPISATIANGKGETAAEAAACHGSPVLATLLKTAEAFQRVPTVGFAELKMQQVLMRFCSRSGMNCLQKLSEGNFGAAFVAQWHGTEVVVKVLKRKPEQWTVDNWLEFANEAIS